jgi:hypothetical protein
MEEERSIYLILSKLGSAYSMFVSTFYAMREALGEESYETPTLESFCVSLIREEDKLVQFGLINTASPSNKALVSHRKINPSIPRSNIIATTKNNIRVRNLLRQLQLLLVTKEQNIKVRILTDIATFVIKMVMMNPNVSRRWQL